MSASQESAQFETPQLRRVRDLVLQHGWNATVYQLINPGIEHWFPPGEDAVVGYVQHHHTRVVAGAPVCEPARLGAVAAAFEQDAAQAGLNVCYFGAEARLEAIYGAARSHSLIVLGAQPAWQPAHWAQMLAQHASLRAQLNRARNKQVRVTAWSIEQATDHPALRACLQQWLSTRGLPPLHFLVEPQTLTRLFDRKVFVAERKSEVIGFLVASPVPQRSGWLIEQIIRGQGAVNGTAELLIETAVRWMASEQSTYVTLGLSPLSSRADIKLRPNPFWLRLLLSWARLHGRRFYNFDGLDAFKAKFRPERWEPVYAISNEPRFAPATLYAIAAAFSGGSPLVLLARALGQAVAQELSWLGRRARQVLDRRA